MIEVTKVRAFFKISLIALIGVVAGSCANPGLDKSASSGSSSDNSEVLYEGAITSWMDETLSAYYLYNEEYASLSRITSLSYDLFLNSTLMQMTGNVLDKKSYNINGTIYTQLYTYITQSPISSYTKSSSATTAVGFGLASVEYLTLSSVTGGLTSWINVQGVYSGSEAAESGIRRGTVITIIDGVNVGALTASEVYAKLMQPTSGTTITIATYNEGEGTKSVKLTAKATDINPILKSKVIEDSASGKKIGYLLYSSFLSAFDSNLKSEIEQFKSAGITDLILDLRVNGGGYVSSASLLASMIGGDITVGKKFSYYRYNSDMTTNYGVTEAISGAKYDQSNSLFYEMFNTSIDNSQKLSLSTIYVIATSSTASASEMVINSLRGAGVNVILVGDTNSINDATNGKNAGMIVSTKNTTSYSYEFAPISFEIFNGEGEGGYKNGISFDYKVSEHNSSYYLYDYSETEPLTAKAIALITGSAATKTEAKAETISESSKEYRLIERENIQPQNNSSRGAMIIIENQ
ncbi:MAG: S41 family peptidase [Rikenellaceae bacterium]